MWSYLIRPVCAIHNDDAISKLKVMQFEEKQFQNNHDIHGDLNDFKVNSI